VCIPLLEEMPELEGRIITGDAMLTSRGIARYILDRGAHYLFDIGKTGSMSVKPSGSTLNGCSSQHRD